jgi:hypothetical protein
MKKGEPSQRYNLDGGFTIDVVNTFNSCEPNQTELSSTKLNFATILLLSQKGENKS